MLALSCFPNHVNHRIPLLSHAMSDANVKTLMSPRKSAFPHASEPHFSYCPFCLTWLSLIRKCRALANTLWVNLTWIAIPWDWASLILLSSLFHQLFSSVNGCSVSDLCLTFVNDLKCRHSFSALLKIDVSLLSGQCKVFISLPVLDL